MGTTLRTLALALLPAAIWAQPLGGPGGAIGDGIWTRNAAFGEVETFDQCNGHQPNTGQYHHHLNPVCLRAQMNDNVTVVSTGRLGALYAEKTSGWTHSPILGWSFDGYPVYGPYGYSDPTNPNSAIKRVQSSFQLRSLTQRHTLPIWILPYLSSYSQTLTATQYGPDVSAQYPLGRYTEDYDYAAGSGDLDQYNGRFTVTPDYPSGTYAYFVTLSAADGTPTFPYIFNVQYYGTTSGGSTQTVATDAVEYFNNGALQQPAATDPELANWYTKGSQGKAEAISGWDPSAGNSTTWPTNSPAGVTVSGGNDTPAPSDVQQVRYDASAIYVTSNNLPSYIIGPWFEATMTGGVFMNWPESQPTVWKLSRAPAAAAAKVSSGMGPVGVWVNGVAIFNTLDGGSYSNSAGQDEGGGGITPRAAHFSAASQERGPIAPGSLVTAYAEFNAVLSTSTASAGMTPWPQTLGGATVTVTDSTEARLPAGILYASPTQVNYQVPANAATGVGTVTIAAAGTAVTGTVNITATYPGIFKSTADGLAAAQTVTANVVSSVTATPVSLASGPVYLVVYGTGIGTAPVTGTIGGLTATVTYSGAQGSYPGLDQVNLLIPSSLAGKGKVTVAVTAAGKPANPVYINLQ